MVSPIPMDHWRVTLHTGRKQMTVLFSKGLGHKGAEPTVAEVLECISADSTSVENARDFSEWCNEYGFDTADRSHRPIYTQCQKQAARLRKFLGEDAYETLLWHTQV